MRGPRVRSAGEGWDVLASLRRAALPGVTDRPLPPADAHLRSDDQPLHRLERAGLIVRVPDPSDARGLLVELTERGHRLVEQIAPRHLANERALLEALTTPEQRTLADLLAKLLTALEASEGAGRSRTRLLVSL